MMLRFLLLVCWIDTTTAFVSRGQTPSSFDLSACGSSTTQFPLPITLLAGFLGTGKTSALQHLLRNKEQRKLGVIVNDLARVNIDSKLVSTDPSTGILHLENGCACCEASEQLLDTIQGLQQQSQSLDDIVVELSGVADPGALVNEISLKLARVPRVVTIVDAGSFSTDYMTWDFARDRPQWVSSQAACAGNNKVAELLCEQVEAADLVLVNKIDVVDQAEKELVHQVVKGLNKKAEVQETKFCKVSPSLLLKKPSCCGDPSCGTTKKAKLSPAVAGGQSGEQSGETKCQNSSCNDPGCADPSCESGITTSDLGIKSFVYQATRPFQYQRLMQVLSQWPVPINEVLDVDTIMSEAPVEVGGLPAKVVESPFLGVLRSKGFCWFAPQSWSGPDADTWRHDAAMLWSQAGRQFGISSAGKWWASLTDAQMQDFFGGQSAEYERIKREDFKTSEFGDRRQEIVFIGAELAEETITATLDACLLTNDEMSDYDKELQYQRIETTPS